MILEVPRDPKSDKITQNRQKTPPKTLPGKTCFQITISEHFWSPNYPPMIPKCPPKTHEGSKVSFPDYFFGVPLDPFSPTWCQLSSFLLIWEPPGSIVEPPGSILEPPGPGFGLISHKSGQLWSIPKNAKNAQHSPFFTWKFIDL